MIGGIRAPFGHLPYGMNLCSSRCHGSGRVLQFLSDGVDFEARESRRLALLAASDDTRESRQRHKEPREEVGVSLGAGR